MGIIKKVLDSFDSSDEQAAEQKANVRALADLGEAKADLFKAQITESLLGGGTGTNKTIPVESVIRAITQVRAFSSTEASNIGGEVSDVLGTFLSGGQKGIIDGVGKLITNTLSLFLGSSSGSSNTTEEYYVATEGYSCIRVDIRAWYYSVESKSLRAKMEKIMCVVAVKSVVDLSRMKFNTFLNLYNQQLVASGMDQNDIIKALDMADKAFKKFQETTKKNELDAPTEILIPPAFHSLPRQGNGISKPARLS